MRSRTLGAVCATCAVAVPVCSEEAQAQIPAPPPPGQDIVAGRPPASIEYARKRMLLKRQLRLEGRRRSLQGEHLSLRERDKLGAELSALTPQRLRAKTRGLLHELHALRRRDGRRDGGAPDVPIPAALEAIARCESGGDPRAISASGTYRGKYQFDFGTWATVGGRGDPAAASETEQDRRAALLYKRSGATPWPVCANA